MALHPIKLAVHLVKLVGYPLELVVHSVNPLLTDFFFRSKKFFFSTSSEITILDGYSKTFFAVLPIKFILF